MGRLVAAAPGRLDRFLADHTPDVSRTRLEKWIAAGEVRVDGVVVTKPGFKLFPDMVVEFETPGETVPHDLSPSSAPFGILFEDDAMMVVNKPRGMATHPAPSLKEPSLVNALLGYGATLSEGSASFRPGIVHRLDKDTTGVMLVAKTDEAHRSLARQIEKKTAIREYLAIVAGEVLREEFSIQAPIGRDPQSRQRMAVDARGKPAITHVWKIQKVLAGTLVRCRLETGRTHQIRVHLRSMGHPVIGDPIYAPKEYQTAPLQLHAWRIEFDHPVTGERMTFEAPTPDGFLGVVHRAKL